MSKNRYESSKKVVCENLFRFFDTPYYYFYYICMKLWCAHKWVLPLGYGVALARSGWCLSICLSD